MCWVLGLNPERCRSLFGEDKHAKMMDVMIKAELEVQRRLEDPTRRWVAPFTKASAADFAIISPRPPESVSMGAF